MHNIHPSICGVVPPPTLEGPVANAERSSQRHHVASIARLRPRIGRDTSRRHAATALVAFTFIVVHSGDLPRDAATVRLGNRVGPATKTRELTRDTRTGRFVQRREPKRRPSTTVVETMKYRKRPKW